MTGRGAGRLHRPGDARGRVVACAFAILVLLACVAASAGADQEGKPTDAVSPDNPAVREADARADDRARARQANRDSVAGREQRARSKDAYRGATGDEAERIARRELHAVVDEPAWRTPASTLRPGERIAEYSSDTSLLIENERGQESLMESPGPLRGRDQSGKPAPLDLQLEARGGSFAPAAPATRYDLPDAAGGSIAFPGAGVSLRSRAPSQSRARLLGDKLFYPNVGEDADMIVAAKPRGVELIFQLRSPAAPEQYRFGVDLPDGGYLRHAGDGSERIEAVAADGSPLAEISAATAWDAQDQDVPVETTIDGNDLVITVHHQQRDVAYPIAVDPDVVAIDNVDENQLYWTGTKDFLGWGPVDYSTGHIFHSEGNSIVGDSLNLYTKVGVGFINGQWKAWKFTAPRQSFIYRAEFAYTSHDPNWSRVGRGIVSADAQWEPVYPNRLCSSYTGAGVCTQPPGGSLQVDGTLNRNWYVACASSNPCAWEGSAGNQAWFYLQMTNTVSDPVNRALAYQEGSYIYEFDYNNPTITSASDPFASGWHRENTTSTFTAYAHDDGLGIRRIMLDFPDGSTASRWSTTNPDKPNYCGDRTARCWADFSDDFSYNTNQLPAGRDTMTVRAADAVGRTGATSYTVRVDKTAPTQSVGGTLKRPDGTWVKDGTYTLSDAPSDSLSGVQRDQFTIGPNAQWQDTITNKKSDGTICDAASGCATTLPHNWSWTTPSGQDGPHQVVVATNDPLGHASPSTSWTVNVDSQPPSRSAGPSGSLWDNRSSFIGPGTYDFHVSAADPQPGSGVRAIHVSVNGNEDDTAHATQACSLSCPASMPRDYTFDATARGPGTYRIVATAEDLVSHAPTTLADFTVTVVGAPQNTSLPVVTGTARDGDVLSAGTGNWSSGGAPTSYEYQWQHCDAQGANCQDLTGETDAAIALRSEDVATRIRVRVTAKTVGGSTTVSSDASVTVLAVAPVASDTPEAAGEPTIGETLAATTGEWSGSTPMAYAYQWLRCSALDTSLLGCAPIAGATAADYTVVAADSGQTLRVRVVASNSLGAASSASTSDATDAVGSFVVDPTEVASEDPPAPTAAEDLAEAQRLRQELGFDSSATTIQALDADSSLQDSRDLYGLSLSRYELRQVELESDIETTTGTISDYGTTVAPDSYAGYYVDSGGQFHIGFTTNAPTHLDALKAQFGYPSRLHAFTATYTEASMDGVLNRIGDDADDGTLATLGVDWIGAEMDVEANRVNIEVVNPSASVQATLAARYGPSVVMTDGDPVEKTNRARTLPQQPKGGLIVYTHPPNGNGDCTLGYVGSAYSTTSAQRTQAWITAGHCSDSYGYYPDPNEPRGQVANPENWHQGRRSIGKTEGSTVYNSDKPKSGRSVDGKVHSDAVTVALAGRFGPKPLVFLKRHRTATVTDKQTRDDEDNKGTLVCASLGAGSNHVRCGHIVTNRRVDPGSPKVRNSRLVTFHCNPGDSGSPVFRYLRKGGSYKIKAMGMVFARQHKSHRCVYSSMEWIHNDVTFQPELGG